MVSGSGIQWDNLAKPVNVDDDYTMANVWGMLIFDTIIYWFIMIFVDNVFPGEYGIAQPWYFLCSVSYFCVQSLCGMGAWCHKCGSCCHTCKNVSQQTNMNPIMALQPTQHGSDILADTFH